MSEQLVSLLLKESAVFPEKGLRPIREDEGHVGQQKVRDDQELRLPAPDPPMQQVVVEHRPARIKRDLSDCVRILFFSDPDHPASCNLLCGSPHFVLPYSPRMKFPFLRADIQEEHGIEAAAGKVRAA